MSKSPSPNDNRSNVMNPNHPAHPANNDNRSGQLNPQHPNYGGSTPAAPTTPAPVIPNSK